MTAIKTEIKIITPEFAQKLLARNSKNRAVNLARVKAIAAEMAAGRFMFNGDTVKVDSDGELLDGQHRCHGCVASGVPFTTLFISGIPRDVMPTIDQHSKRTNGHVLQLSGYSHATNTAAVVNICAGIATGVYSGANLSPSEILDTLQRHPGMHDSAAKTKKTFPGVGTMLGAIHYIASFVGRYERADSFIAAWETGVPDYTGCAAHQARERLVRASAAAGGMTRSEKVRLIIGAWNNFDRGAPVSKSSIKSSPVIRGWNDAALASSKFIA